jgi:Rad3-related DNA helicase
MIKNKTSIIIENSTRNELRKIGRKEQTYDQLIKELIGIKQNLELGRKNSEFHNYSSKKSSLSQELEYL